MYDAIDSGAENKAAKVISQLPGHEKWNRHPLPRQYKQMVQELDEQTLMSLIEYAVKEQLERPEHPPRRFEWV